MTCITLNLTQSKKKEHIVHSNMKRTCMHAGLPLICATPPDDLIFCKHGSLDNVIIPLVGRDLVDKTATSSSDQTYFS